METIAYIAGISAIGFFLLSRSSSQNETQENYVDSRQYTNVYNVKVDAPKIPKTKPANTKDMFKFPNEVKN